MCFHDYEARYRYEQEVALRRADPKQRIAWLHVRPIGDKKTKFSMPVDCSELQDISNTLLDLMTWHPGCLPDLEAVNEHRYYKLDLGHVSLDRLPKPNRVALPDGVDVDEKDGKGQMEEIERYMRAGKELLAVHA